MTFPNVVERIYSLKNSDLCVIGEHLGYEWNLDEVIQAVFTNYPEAKELQIVN